MIANHMSELAEEILSYHRDEDYKIVRLRDDLISRRSLCLHDAPARQVA